MRNIKSIIIIILIILLGLSIYFGFFYNKFLNLNAASKKDLFERKQECGAYRVEVEKLLREKNDFSLSRNTFGEIFYSPSLNTCLYSYTSIYVDADGKPMDIKIMGKNYVIDDYLTGQNIFFLNTALYELDSNLGIENKSTDRAFYEEKIRLKK
jgi:hypothetical protein